MSAQLFARYFIGGSAIILFAVDVLYIGKWKLLDLYLNVY